MGSIYYSPQPKKEPPIIDVPLSKQKLDGPINENTKSYLKERKNPLSFLKKDNIKIESPNLPTPYFTPKIKDKINQKIQEVTEKITTNLQPKCVLEDKNPLINIPTNENRYHKNNYQLLANKNSNLLLDNKNNNENSRSSESNYPLINLNNLENTNVCYPAIYSPPPLSSSDNPFVYNRNKYEIILRSELKSTNKRKRMFVRNNKFKSRKIKKTKKNFIKYLDTNYKIKRLILHEKISNKNIKKFGNTIATSLRGQSYFYKDGTLYIYRTLKIAYCVKMDKDSTVFYFIVPERYEGAIIEEAKNAWKINMETVDRIDNLPSFRQQNALNLEYNDIFSLGVDTKSDANISSLLNLQKTLKDKECIFLYFNFQPITKRNWQNISDTFIKKRKLNQNTRKSIVNTSNLFLSTVSDVGYSILRESAITLVGMLPEPKESLSKDPVFKPSKKTQAKKTANLINTQAMVFVSANEKQRESELAMSIHNCFKQQAEGDNRFVIQKILLDEKLDLFSSIKSRYPSFIIYPDELHNLLQLPTKVDLTQNETVEHAKVEEIPLPTELKSGITRIGTATYNRVPYVMYFSTDKHHSCLPVILVGPPRCGKTSLIQNMALDNSKGNQANIIFDFCGACELSKELRAIIPKEKQVVIDAGGFNHIESFCFSEAMNLTKLNMTDPNKHPVFEHYKMLKTVASQAALLLDSVSEKDRQLSQRMKRFLYPAIIIMLMTNGTFMDILNILKDKNFRDKKISEVYNKYILNNTEMSDGKTLDGKIYENLLTSNFENLRELDKEDEESDMKNIIGIIDRFQALQENAYMEQMLLADPLNNIDIIKEVQQGKTIFIQLPTDSFNSKAAKDAVCTFWITRIIYALEIRKCMYTSDIEFYKNAVMVNLFIDELYQVPHCMEVIKEKINQIAKTKLKAIISCHHLNQFPPLVKNEIKNASGDCVFITGTRAESLDQYEEELKPFSIQDLVNLPRYHSLNYVNSNNGFVKFISKLPPPIEGRA